MEGGQNCFFWGGGRGCAPSHNETLLKNLRYRMLRSRKALLVAIPSFRFIGEPNKPNVMNIELTKDNLTITWDIEKHELRPVDTYVIKIRITGSRNQDSDSKDDSDDGDSSRAEIVEFNTTMNGANVNCKPNTTKDLCLLTVEREIDKAKTYNVIVCAKNNIGTTCSDPTVIVPKPSLLKPSDRLPTGSIVGIVFGVIVAILVCCLLWMLIALIICCTCCEREKVYNPEKKGQCMACCTPYHTIMYVELISFLELPLIPIK